MEQKYLAIYKQHPKEATALINKFEQVATDNALKVTNEIFTTLTQKADMASHFAGA